MKKTHVKRFAALFVAIAMLATSLVTGVDLLAHEAGFEPVVVWSLRNDTSFQSLEADTIIAGNDLGNVTSGFLQQSGGPTFTAIAGLHGTELQVTDRSAGNWNTVDIVHSLASRVVDHNYSIEVIGRVIDSTGSTVILGEPNPPFGWLVNVNTEDVFHLDLAVTQATFATHEQATQRIRFQSQDTVDYVIEDIIITQVSKNESVEPPILPDDNRLGILYQLSTDDQIQELELGTTGSSALQTAFLNDSGNPAITIVESVLGGNAIQVSDRVNGWDSIDLDRNAVGIRAGNHYTVEFIGRMVNPNSMDQPEISHPDSPWSALPPVDNSGFVHSDGSFHIVVRPTQAQLNSPGLERGFRIRTAGTDAFIIDDIIVTRTSLGEDTFDPEAGLALTLAQIPLHETWADYFLIGNVFQPHFAADDRGAILAHHFNAVTAENCMKPDATQRVRDVFTFDNGWAMTEFARANNMTNVGHTLVWHSQNLPWMNDSFSREEAIEVLKTHIYTVMNAFPDVLIWDVVNEAIHPNNRFPTSDWQNQLRDTVWLRTIGPDYIEIAFRYAHEVNPNVILYYNDYNLNVRQKAEATAAMVEDLRSQGVPIHGIGMQGHYNHNTIISTAGDSLRLFESIRYSGSNYGLAPMEVSFTEVDITFRPASGMQDGEGRLTPEGELRQAQMYAELMQIIRSYEHMIERVTFWGMRDTDSWRPDGLPNLFNPDNSPKLAFFAVQDPDAFLAENPIPGRPDRDVRRGNALQGTPSSEFDPAAFVNAPEFRLETTGAAVGAGAQASGVARVLFDDTHLHVLFEVADSSPCTAHPTDMHEQDSVEVFVSMFNSISPQYMEGDYQLRVSRDGVESAGGTGLMEGFTSFVENRGTQGYTVQLSFPLDADLTYGSVLGFDLQINNAMNGNRVSTASWNNQEDTNWSNTLNFGELLLGETEGTTDVVVLDVDLDAVVTQLRGNQNELTVTVTELLSDGTTNVITETLLIDNNSDVTVEVGEYQVFVSTRGNTQIRALHIVE